MTTPFDPLAAAINRRTFLRRCGVGLGAAALTALEAETRGGGDPLPRFRPRVSRVIWLYMAGGPSQFETFDPKPKLRAMDGEPMP